MLQVDVSSDVTDSIKRIGFEDAVAKGISPDPTDDGKNVIHSLRSQTLFEQLRLEQLDIALADVYDPALTEFFLDVHSLADVINDGTGSFERALNLKPAVNAFLHGAL
ncbi:hypothetical protein D3C73_1303760 [compost metagenome]